MSDLAVNYYNPYSPRPADLKRYRFLNRARTTVCIILDKAVDLLMTRVKFKVLKVDATTTRQASLQPVLFSFKKYDVVM